MSGKIIAYGAKVERSPTQDGTYERIPNCRGVAIPAVTTDFQEVTDLDSQNGFREFLKGLKDAGEVGLPMWYTADGYEAMSQDEARDDPTYYRVTLRPQTNQTTGDMFEFAAYPTPQVTSTDDVGVPLEMETNLRMTGAPSWTRGAA